MDRLSRLVVDLLEVSKLDRGVLELRYDWTDLGEIVKECISNFQIQYPERLLHLSTVNEPVWEKVDPVRIYEVVSNLLDNAIKYSPENTPIDIQLNAQPDKIYFSITDRGKGMSKDIQNRLFGAFERENCDTKKDTLASASDFLFQEE
jgi:two-component system sensor histidine kinase KdpD